MYLGAFALVGGLWLAGIVAAIIVLAVLGPVLLFILKVVLKVILGILMIPIAIFKLFTKSKTKTV